MDKKGFTLVELLAVIAILAILATITLFATGNILSTSRENLSDTQKESLERAAKIYYLEEGMDSNEECVNISTLIEKGYIEESEVKDPKDKTEMTGSVLITYESDKYTYTYQSKACE